MRLNFGYTARRIIAAVSKASTITVSVMVSVALSAGIISGPLASQANAAQMQPLTHAHEQVSCNSTLENGHQTDRENPRAEHENPREKQKPQDPIASESDRNALADLEIQTTRQILIVDFQRAREAISDRATANKIVEGVTGNSFLFSNSFVKMLRGNSSFTVRQGADATESEVGNHVLFTIFEDTREYYKQLDLAKTAQKQLTDDVLSINVYSKNVADQMLSDDGPFLIAEISEQDWSKYSEGAKMLWRDRFNNARKSLGISASDYRALREALYLAKNTVGGRELLAATVALASAGTGAQIGSLAKANLRASMTFRILSNIAVPVLMFAGAWNGFDAAMHGGLIPTDGAFGALYLLTTFGASGFGAWYGGMVPKYYHGAAAKVRRLFSQLALKKMIEDSRKKSWFSWPKFTWGKNSRPSESGTEAFMEADNKEETQPALQTQAREITAEMIQAMQPQLENLSSLAIGSFAQDLMDIQPKLNMEYLAMAEKMDGSNTKMSTLFKDLKKIGQQNAGINAEATGKLSQMLTEIKIRRARLLEALSLIDNLEAKHAALKEGLSLHIGYLESLIAQTAGQMAHSTAGPTVTQEDLLSKKAELSTVISMQELNQNVLDAFSAETKRQLVHLRELTNSINLALTQSASQTIKAKLESDEATVLTDLSFLNLESKGYDGDDYP